MRVKIILFILVSETLLLVSCGTANQDFKQVGYYKGAERHRIFTFNSETLDINAIKEHGASQMNTSGRITWSFYYRGNAPDITLLTFDGAYDRCLLRKPVAKVGILMNGKVVLVENPIE